MKIILENIKLPVLLLVYLLLINNEIDCHNGKRVKRIVGGRESARPPPDDPVVFAHMYERDARVEGFRNKQNGIYNFLGIRYADPPVGPNRFLRPNYRRLEGDIMALKYGPPCPQPDQYNPNKVIGSEDCLILNIYTPQMPDETTGLPVYVWIHPGGFRYGSANQYDAQPLAQQGMIFVPIQYRLGTLGIIGDNTKDFSGNLAMFDMTVALRWVTEYISFFGGDPKQIKVIGHGSGAASAMYMGMQRLPRSSGSVNGIVSMSGSALSQYAIDEDPVQSVEEIAMINECPTTNELEIVKCLRTKTADDIIIKDSMVQTERLQGRAMVKGIAGGVGFNPHMEDPDDGRSLPGFLTAKPDDTLKEAKYEKIPLLIGVTKHETGNGITLQAVSKIWGSAEKFLNSLLDTITNLKKFLKIDETTGALLKPILPGLGQLGINLNDFLKVPPTLNAIEVLQKLTETTTDVLFNLPAVLSAELWGKLAPAFLYSFEFKGNVSKGSNFLHGLPIVSAGNNPNYTAHGDDLGYLFEANDLFGEPIPGAKLTNEKDLKTRNNFISLLKKFANLNSNSTPGGDSIFQRFSGKGTPFIKITDKLDILNNFRFCELSLWGAPLQAIQSTTCQGLFKGLGIVTGTLDKVTGDLTKPISGLTGDLTRPLGGLGGVGGLGGRTNNNRGGILGLG